jgi:Ca2+ transporting ATPase
MGIEGTDLAKESAGIILLDDNFSTIVSAVVWGRNIYDNIRRFIQFQLTVNVIAVSLAIVGACAIKQSPLTAIQMLWVNLIMDTLASLALATEKPNKEILLGLTPQNKDEYIVSALMWKHIFGQAFFQCTIFFAIIFAGEWFLPEFGDEDDDHIMFNPEDDRMVRSGRLFKVSGGEDYYEYQKDLDVGPSRHFTYLFNIFVLMQLGNEFNARKIRDEINIFEKLTENSMFIVIWLVELCLQALLVSVCGIGLHVHVYGLDGL